MKAEGSKEHDELNQNIKKAIDEFIEKTGGYVHWVSVDHMEDKETGGTIYDVGSRVYDR